MDDLPHSRETKRPTPSVDHVQRFESFDDLAHGDALHQIHVANDRKKSLLLGGYHEFRSIR
jgi:hypothetical protein